MSRKSDTRSSSGPINPPSKGTSSNTTDPAKFRNQGAKARYSETRTTRDMANKPPSKGAR